LDIPAEATEASRILQVIFGSDLVAVYLYGSATTTGLASRSDVDVLAVVAGEPTAEARRKLGRHLLGASGRYPPLPGDLRPLEVSIFDQTLLAGFHHPVRGEFVYGEWLREDFEAGVEPMPSINPDFTLLLAQARQEGVALYGPPAAAILPQVAPEDVHRAILDALPELLGSLEGDERNVILTLARMWFTVSTGRFASKAAAAEWAAHRVSPDTASILDLARGGYIGAIADDWHQRRTEVLRVAHDLSEKIHSTA
jgi:predicted nucleotidyltransferase